ncbi:Centrosomal protein of 68 kDa [Bagarius yarrelli]|uniref:Centrosomal protein of 68 kDa n=1 Tax=Bagarius yarrelli TaxID=175774 RepID=A0A556TMS8_BAGYA|nr:Centrosomal protein of 68 kDa [Bagarius yarrelli]
MEQRNDGRHKSRIPAFIRSGYTRHRLTKEASDTSQLRHGQDAKKFNQESGTSKKAVTMAPTSRYMTGRSLYMKRKPLISSKNQVSILKNPLTHEDSEEVQMSHVVNCQFQEEETNSNIVDNSSDLQIITSSPLESREDICASLNLSDLRLGSQEEPDFSPFHLANKFESLSSISSSHFDNLSLTASFSPNLTSTQRNLPHSYTSQNYTSQRANTKAYNRERQSLIDTGFSVRNSRSYSSEPKRMSNHQTAYWACAIPSDLPPSPNRKSPNWDPDMEYQTLLDYTYPLRPDMTNACTLNKHRFQTDQPFQDSGIEVESFRSSSSLSFLEQPLSRMRQDKYGPVFNHTLGFQSPNLRKLAPSKSSDPRVSRSLNSSLEQVGLSLESLDCGQDNFHYKKFGIFSKSRSAPTFIRSTSILPHLGLLGECDEEFLQLPEQLQEIQDLSQKLKGITAQISQPATSNWEPLETRSHSSPVQVEKQAAEVSHAQVSSEDISHSEQMEEVNSSVKLIGHQVTSDSLRKVEAIASQLTEMSSYWFKRKTETDEVVEETQESLLQHIQIFCSNLQQLIQWLHQVVEKMDVLSPPLMDIESVKASLADYKSFQEEVQSHRPLTTSVLQTGKMLLCCMNSASPFLKDTLMLIERQSCALETHSEHLFSSILSTMDCLAEPNSQDNTGAFI